jgi:hypothetical protein
VFYASTQTGPVLDFKGWLAPGHFQGRVRHCDFFVRGSGVADASKANIGVRVDYISSTTFSDISVMATGGPCWKITATVPGYACYMCDFERITLHTPVGAAANDVPYFYSVEANGNRFRGFGLISNLTTLDTGVSGAVVIEGSVSYSSHDNLFDAWWFENLHLPTNGCLVSAATNSNLYRDFQYFDIKRELGATGTTMIRLLNSLAANFGGNEVSGVIPGDNNGAAASPESGVDVRQSSNSVDGIKGYKGNNVLIAAGIHRTYVHFRGAVSNATNIGWVDSSGQTDNRLIDSVAGIEIRPTSYTVNGTSTVPPNIQVFTTSGTWTKPAGVTTVTGVIIGAGGGGGSGRRDAAGTVRCGGGGGGGSGVTRFSFPASALPATVAVSVPATAAGGAAVATDATSGNAGTSGPPATFGTFARAIGGTGGSGGTAATGTGGGAGTGTSNGGLGASASTTGLVGGGAGFGSGASGGAAGGGITSANVAAGGGTGLAAPTVKSAAAAGGLVDSTPPVAGDAAVVGVATPGGSGGGGAASITTAAQAGADGGIYGAGGSGGGASLNGNASGAGGAGAPGIVLVVSA